MYETLLMEADADGLITKEKPLIGHEGRILGNRIAIKEDMPTSMKTCALAEELGHYHTAVGDIIDQSETMNRKIELKGRLWAYNRLIGLNGIVNAFRDGQARSLNEMADYFGVSQQFLAEALERYQDKYGTYTELDNYIIYFIPTLAVLET